MFCDTLEAFITVARHQSSPSTTDGTQSVGAHRNTQRENAGSPSSKQCKVRIKVEPQEVRVDMTPANPKNDIQELMRYAADMLRKIRKDSKKIKEKVMNTGMEIPSKVLPRDETLSENDIEPTKGDKHYEFQGSPRQTCRPVSRLTKRDAPTTTRPYKATFEPWSAFENSRSPLNDRTQFDGSMMNKRTRME